MRDSTTTTASADEIHALGIKEVVRFRGELEKIKTQLAQRFGRAPKAPLEIRPVDKLIRNSAWSHYILPAIDGSRPGVFYAVIHDPVKYTTPFMAALFLHEGQPATVFKWRFSKNSRYQNFADIFDATPVATAALCMQKAWAEG